MLSPIIITLGVAFSPLKQPEGVPRAFAFKRWFPRYTRKPKKSTLRKYSGLILSVAEGLKRKEIQRQKIKKSKKKSGEKITRRKTTGKNQGYYIKIPLYHIVKNTNPLLCPLQGSCPFYFFIFTHPLCVYLINLIGERTSKWDVRRFKLPTQRF